MKKPTFQEFVDEAFRSIFDALITGGTKSMKAQLQFCIAQAVRIVSVDGGFAKE